MIETYLFDGDTRHPASARAVGDGMPLVLHAYVTLKKPQEWMDAIDFTDAGAAP
jgi:hypothetical protein